MTDKERYAPDIEAILSHRHDNGADLWTTAREARIGRLRQLIGDLLVGPPTVAKLTVAAGLVAELAE